MENTVQFSAGDLIMSDQNIAYCHGFVVASRERVRLNRIKLLHYEVSRLERLFHI
jgi:hypothetical protein